MDQLYPTYDILYLEQRADPGLISYNPKSREVDHNLFVPPTWLSQWPNVTLDESTKSVSTAWVQVQRHRYRKRIGRATCNCSGILCMC